MKPLRSVWVLLHCNVRRLDPSSWAPVELRSATNVGVVAVPPCCAAAVRACPMRAECPDHGEILEPLVAALVDRTGDGRWSVAQFTVPDGDGGWWGRVRFVAVPCDPAALVGSHSRDCRATQGVLFPGVEP